MTLAKKNKTIVVGHTGQDGTLLIEALLDRGDEVLGISRTNIFSTTPMPKGVQFNIANKRNVDDVMKAFSPDEVYYLAAHHSSSEMVGNDESLFHQFQNAHAVHVLGLFNFLTAIEAITQTTRLFYASSSLVFSGENGEMQDEETPLTPEGFYGITKAEGMYLCREFRNKHNVYAAVGILYNHESHLRPFSFVSSKIINSAIRIARGSNEKLEIGSLASKVDWGYARDYVSAFQKILAHETPEEFVVATGEAHTINEFIDIVFGYFNLNPKEFVIENRNILARIPAVKIGNSQKLRDLTGWKPSYSYSGFVRKLIEDHLANQSAHPV